MQRQIDQPKTDFDAQRTAKATWADTFDMLAAASENAGKPAEWVRDYQTLQQDAT